MLEPCRGLAPASPLEFLGDSRTPIVVVFVVVRVAVASTAAAEEPSPARPAQVTLEKPARIRHTLAGDYAAELSGFTDGTSSAGAASVGANLPYHAALINKAGHATYDIETAAGLTVGRMEGTFSATQVATQAHLRIGPAMVPASDDHANLAWFPFSFELDHTGEVAALPRLSARPDANRGVFDRGEVALATRLVRIEVNDHETDSELPPREVEPHEPSSSAIDLITMFGEVEATMQDGARLEASVGGAFLSVTNRHTYGHRVDVLAIEERFTQLPDQTKASIATLWVLKAEFSNPTTGSTYTLGWGVAIGGPYRELATPTEENPTPDLDIGGLGLWWDRSWGGIGFQALRQPYITMAGEPSLDDRGWIEAWRTGRHSLSARGYLARTLRSADGVWRSDWSTGLELGAHRTFAGITVDLTLEAGRTHYAALDGMSPEIGFAARSQLSLRHWGRRTWKR